MFRYDMIALEKAIIIDVKWDGVFTLNMMNAYVDQLYGDPDYSPEMNGIADIRSAYFDVTQEELKAHQDYIANHPYSSKGHWAVIVETIEQVGSTSVSDGYSAEEIDIKMFSNRDDALEWLKQFN